MEKVNLNTADRSQLDQIPNIGSACVDRILSERRKRGRFQSIDELDQLGGFGREAIDNLRQHATV